MEEEKEGKVTLVEELLSYFEERLRQASNKSPLRIDTPSEMKRIENLIRTNLDSLETDVRRKIDRRVREIVAETERERKRLERERRKKELEEEYVQRFGIHFRIQHLILFVSCILLIITGLPLKFYYTQWAKVMFQLLGGFKTAGLIHRVGAMGLIIVAVYHTLYTIFS
ncbi:MAG: hypothetical protein ACE5QV_03525, partial [Fidelibacterota bacterium]